MPEQNIDYRVVVFGAGLYFILVSCKQHLLNVYNILGGVGKSSLVLRFIKGTFKDSYIPTIEDTYRQVMVLSLFQIPNSRYLIVPSTTTGH